MRLAPCLPFLVPVTWLAFAACNDSSDPPPETLTCEVAASPEFCWTVAAVESVACIDSTMGNGTFNADRTACDYSDGSRVEFDEAVPDNPDLDHEWNFSVMAADGSECMRFEDTETSATIVSASGTVLYSLSGALGIDLECPDGELLHTGNGLNLFDCEEPDVVLPGYSFGGGGGSVSWQLQGATESVWSCGGP